MCAAIRFGFGNIVSMFAYARKRPMPLRVPEWQVSRGTVDGPKDYFHGIDAGRFAG